jgi:hypothetical protein
VRCNVGLIILDNLDQETGKEKDGCFIRMIYLHELVHGILGTMGVKHEEKLVSIFGLLLYEALNMFGYN